MQALCSSFNNFLAHLFGKIDFFLLFCAPGAKQREKLSILLKQRNSQYGLFLMQTVLK